MADKLTDKQKRFCDEYLIDLNATQAAIRAGYSEKVAKEIGYENLTKPHIKGRIDLKLQEKAKQNGLSADMVLKDLMELKDKCLGRKPVKQTVLDGEDLTEIQKYIFDSRGANSALELLGKHLKLFTDKVEMEASVGVRIIDDIE